MAMIQDPSWGKTLAEAYKDDLYKMMGESLVFNGVNRTISEYKPRPSAVPARYASLEEITLRWGYDYDTMEYVSGDCRVTREAVENAVDGLWVAPVPADCPSPAETRQKWNDIAAKATFYDNVRVGPTFEQSTPYKRRDNSPWGYGLPSFLTSPHDHNVSDHSVSAVNAGEHSHSLSDEAALNIAKWYENEAKHPLVRYEIGELTKDGYALVTETWHKDNSPIVTISGTGTGASVTYNPTATISYGAKADDPIMEGNIHHSYGRLYYANESGSISSPDVSPISAPTKPPPKETSLDIVVPTSFRIDDYFGVIMRLEDGTLEADPEPYVSEAGAKERARQLMFARPDVVSCATTTVWKRA